MNLVAGRLFIHSSSKCYKLCMTEKVFLYGSLSPTITSPSLKLNRIVECSLTVTALLSICGQQFEGCFKNIIKPRENDTGLLVKIQRFSSLPYRLRTIAPLVHVRDQSKGLAKLGNIVSATMFPSLARP